MPEKNIKLVIEYEGTNYSGWQSQDGPVTIQDEIQKGIFKVTGLNVNLTGAGRTDAGVHALGQVANFLIEHRLEPERYKDAINSYLPDDILIKSSVEVPLEFNSRKNAIFRRYRYLMSSEKSAVYRHQRWHQSQPIYFEKLQEAAKLILGVHDFSPFCVTSSLKENNQCLIEFSRWYNCGPLLIYEIRGNRFLHNMVRSLVGAMVNLALVNQDKNSRNLTLDDFKNMLSSPEKVRAVFTAPPHGLYLVAVGYKKGNNRMKFFIDTCNLDQIKKAMDMGVLDGVTTNPSLAAKESQPYRKILEQICKIVPGPVSAEVISITHNEMVKEGEELVKIAKNIVVKIPTILEGLKAVKTLSDKNIPVNSTLVFSATQAILVAKAGAAYVSPFIGRLDDISQDGMDLIQQIVAIYNNYEYQTEVLVASVRHPMHVVEAALIGADICTIPFSVIEQLIKHPLTDIGLEKFLADFKGSKANQ